MIRKVTRDLIACEKCGQVYTMDKDKDNDVFLNHECECGGSTYHIDGEASGKLDQDNLQFHLGLRKAFTGHAGQEAAE